MVEVPVSNLLSDHSSIRLISWSMLPPEKINRIKVVEDAAKAEIRAQRLITSLLQMLKIQKPDVICLQDAHWMQNNREFHKLIDNGYDCLFNPLTEYITLYNINTVQINNVMTEEPVDLSSLKICISMIKTGDQLVISNVHIQDLDNISVSEQYIRSLLVGDLPAQYIVIGNFNHSYVQTNSLINNNIITSVGYLESIDDLSQGCGFTDGCFFSGPKGICYQARSIVEIDPRDGNIMSPKDLHIAALAEHQQTEIRRQRAALGCGIEHQHELWLDYEIVQLLNQNNVEQSISSNALLNFCLVWKCDSALTRELAAYLHDILSLECIIVDNVTVIYLPVALLDAIEHKIRVYAHQLTSSVLKIYQALGNLSYSTLWSVSPALSDFEKMNSIYNENSNMKFKYACALAREHFKTNLSTNETLLAAIGEFVEPQSLGQTIVNFFGPVESTQQKTEDIQRRLTR